MERNPQIWSKLSSFKLVLCLSSQGKSNHKKWSEKHGGNDASDTHYTWLPRRIR